MKKINLLVLTFLVVMIALSLTGISFATTTFSIDNATILEGETDVFLNFNIYGVDASLDIDSITFDLNLSDGLSLTGVEFQNVPEDWSASSNTSLNRLGAFDNGWPPKALSADLLPFAVLSFQIDNALSISGNNFSIDFKLVEIANSDLELINNDGPNLAFIGGQINVASAPVPIPSTIFLLFSGVAGLMGIRRRRAA